MPETALPISPIPTLSTIELTPDRAPLLQTFFDQNPAYFLATSGEPAGPGEAVEEIANELPDGWRFTKKLAIGYAEVDGALAALANVIIGLFAPSVFHIGTFIVATKRHGTGDAQLLYAGLEQWAASNGAAWLRLGVAQGNTRAERFWIAQGYVPVRERSGIQIGSRLVTVQTMVKPLTGNSFESYLTLVPYDRREGENAR